MPISIKAIRKFIDGIPWRKISKKAENATKGQRLYPSRVHDKRFNFRLDKGATIGKNQQEVVLQANKNADDAQVQKAAQKDSHDILAKCVIDPNNVDEETANKSLKDSFQAKD